MLNDPNSPDHSPSDPSKATAWDSVTDRELDAALANAAALASDLVEELGKSETAQSLAPPNPLEDPRSDLDAELGQLADLTQQAATELDTASRPPAGVAAVPDFMSEFMDPPGEATVPPVQVTPIVRAPTAEPRPVRVPTSAPPAAVGVVGGVINITLPAGKLRKQVDPNAASTSEPAGPPRPSLAERALNPIASGLEMADKPFSKLNGRVRTILGWVALALLAASAILVKYRLQ